jgi:hypothetical protein
MTERWQYADYVQQFLHPRRDVTARNQAVNAQDLADRVSDLHARVQRRIGILKHCLDAAAAAAKFWDR